MSGRGFGRLQLFAQKAEELDVVLPWNLIHPRQHHLGKPGEQLEQSDTRITFVEIRPLFGVERNAEPKFAENILERAVVQHRFYFSKRHKGSLLVWSLVEEKRIHNIEEGIVGADAIIDPNIQPVLLFGRRFDAHVHHINAWFPSDKRFAHLVPNHSAQRSRVGLAHQLIDRTTKLWSHLTFAGTGPEDDFNSLGYELFVRLIPEPARHIRFDWECPTPTEKFAMLFSHRCSPFLPPPLCLLAHRPDRYTSELCRPIWRRVCC